MTEDDRDVPDGNGCCGSVLIVFFGILTILLFPITIFMAIKIIPEYQRAVIFRLGRIQVNFEIKIVKKCNSVRMANI